MPDKAAVRTDLSDGTKFDPAPRTVSSVCDLTAAVVTDVRKVVRGAPLAFARGVVVQRSAVVTFFHRRDTPFRKVGPAVI